MGSSCACPNTQPPCSPRPPPPSNYHFLKPTTPNSSKFVNIIPGDYEQMEKSQHFIKRLNNQIYQYLQQYQQNNGALSRRFTIECQQCSSKIFARESVSSIAQEQTHILTNNKQNQLYLPIGKENDKAKIDQQENSKSFESEGEDQKQESCLLSQQSHILSGSIFTDRLNAKNQFYNQFNQMQQIQLLEWNDITRISFPVKHQEFLIQISKNRPSKLMVILQAIKQYHKTHLLHLLTYSPYPRGIKIYFNGKKRLLPFAQGEEQQISLKELTDKISSLIENYEIGEVTYYLTGWIPESLRMSEIRSYQGIFQRLNSNLEEGNTLIFFSREQNQSISYAALSKIDLQNGLVTVRPFCSSNLLVAQELLAQSVGNQGQLVFKIENFIVLYDTIHLNWNPTIYQYIISRQSQIDSQTLLNKYTLTIPPSSQDIQIRIFIQKHHLRQNQEKSPGLLIKLFQYQNAGDVEDSSPVRVIEADKEAFSDVFIFQSCKQKTKYLLTVQPMPNSNLPQTLCSTITLFSFVQMYFNQLQSNPLLKQTSLQTQINHSNLGFGINSPHFMKNLQFAVEVQPNKELKVQVQVSSALQYQICLIPNADQQPLLTKLNLQNIINNSLISNEKIGSGSFTINTNCSHYLLIINSFSKYQGQINITLKIHGKSFSNCQNTLTIKEIKKINHVIFVQEIKWLPNHSGPRKRLKSNSNDHFQSSDVFSQFFINPIIDKYLGKGKYQFFVRSQTFKNFFDSVQVNDKNECEPPALSMSILEISQSKKQFKIMQDDAYYVPFGIGFWTRQIELQNGLYRFVLPKIEKGFSIGNFGIVKC